MPSYSFGPSLSPEAPVPVQVSASSSVSPSPTNKHSPKK
jgi:hypothetical protein